MLAMAVKEFRQLRRDHRTVAMMVVLPLLLLIVFGYAASFDVTSVRTLVVGPAADLVKGQLPSQLDIVATRPGDGHDQAVEALRRGEATVAVVADPLHAAVLVDGSQLFSARAVVTALAQTPLAPKPEILFNPDLKTSWVMVPAIIGMILVFVGTVATSLGVVRERQAGTLEQLAVMPFKPQDVFLGKILPYFGIAVLDLTIVLVAALLIFGVPFNGNPLVFAVGAGLFLFVTLGLGVLISTVSENQGQAIQLAILTLLPQVLLSGMIFPLESMAAGVRWIGYLLPLTYFTQISRGVLIRGAPIDSLAVPLAALAVLGVVVFSLSVVRFRRDLAPSGARSRRDRTPAGAAA
jgi:ABC-2 type transport system permease protein